MGFSSHSSPFLLQVCPGSVRVTIEGNRLTLPSKDIKYGNMKTPQIFQMESLIPFKTVFFFSFSAVEL